MPKVERIPAKPSIPDNLRPFRFHGVDPRWRDGDANAVADCPWCGREGKFSIKIATSEWKCFICAAKGNALEFARRLWDESDKRTNGEAAAFAAERGLLHAETINLWGVVKSVLTGKWLVPGYDAVGRLAQLYQRIKTNERWELRPTPTLHHQMQGIPLFGKDKRDVHLCESWGNALALWEVMRSARRNDEGGLELCGNPAASLLADANVLAVANCGAVGKPLERFLPLFADKRVFLHFDSDHPKEHNETVAEPAGFAACKRAAALLLSAKQPPTEVLYYNWGPDGYDPTKPSGYDVRDMLIAGATMSDRIAILPAILDGCIPVPDEWAGGRAKLSSRVEINCLDCVNWDVLVEQWKCALKWSEGLDRALSVMLASICSTDAVGDQLWIKVVSPASSGKSVLCEALSVNKHWIFANSTMTGFHSGFKTDKAGDEDHSLLAKLRGKTLVIKDGDTLLQAPNKDKILSEARDIYDRVSRAHYGHGVSRSYEGINLTILLCGTSSLRALDSSELGERFLDCVIVDRIDEDEEDEIGWRVANQAEREMGFHSDGSLESRDEPGMVKAKQLTGGYVDYLRHNAVELIRGVEAPAEALKMCQHYAKFVAFMRARPSPRQEEKAEREMSYRLIKQHVRLAKCLAVVLNRKTLDAEVMRRVRRVAMDTARGKVLDVCKQLRDNQDKGTSMNALSIWTAETEGKLATLLGFLAKIGVVEKFRDAQKHARWRLTRRLRQLWDEVMTKENADA